jgi:predicted nucleic acid-binding protein
VTAVIDASVVVAALLDRGPAGSWALRIIADGGLHAPSLVLVEATNVIRRAERARQVPEQEAQAAFADLLQLDIQTYPFEPFASRIWELRQGLTSYDGWYVVIAEALGLPMATLDLRLARTSGGACRFLTFPEQA